MKQTLYDVLEVSPNASLAVIRAAYKSLVQRFHPDKNPGNPDAENQLKLINHAYETLSDPSSRLAYDAMLAMEEMPSIEETGVVEVGQPERRPFDKRILYGIGLSVLVLISAAGFFTWKKESSVQPAQPAAKESKSPLPSSMPKSAEMPKPASPPLPELVEMPAPLPGPVHEPVAKPVQKPAPRSVQEPFAKSVRKPLLPDFPKPAAVPAAPAPAATQTAGQPSKYADLASAVSSGDEATVRNMLEGGWDPNLVRNNQVPLIIAVKNDDVKMASLLIRHGADVNLTDFQGNTAMIYAKVRADAKMIEILKNAGAKNPFD